MVKIKWFEKYGLGTIDIVEPENDKGMIRYEITTKLYNAIEAFRKAYSGNDYITPLRDSHYFNPRDVNKGKSLRFSADVDKGVSGVVSAAFGAITRETELSAFSRYIERHYKVIKNK